jgi:hypothetical protein
MGLFSTRFKRVKSGKRGEKGVGPGDVLCEKGVGPGDVLWGQWDKRLNRALGRVKQPFYLPNGPDKILGTLITAGFADHRKVHETTGFSQVGVFRTSHSGR